MSQAQTVKTMKNGISSKSPENTKIPEKNSIEIEQATFFDKNQKVETGIVKSMVELETNVALLRQHYKRGVPMELVVSKEVMSQILLDKYPSPTGYMLYKNVTVYEEGRVEEAKRLSTQTANEKLFGGSKLKIQATSQAMGVSSSGEKS